MSIITIIVCVAAYMLGSIPTAVWVGKTFYGIDVREHGSGNAGATNTLRILGKKAGFGVLFIDFLKGFAAANLVIFLKHLQPQTDVYFQMQMLLGALAVIGHIYPVFAGFKGGKGIATLVGVVTAMDYRLALMCFITFFIIVFITRFISLGSIISAILSPVFAVWLYHLEQRSLLYFFIGVAVLVVYTHRANIKRLLNGNENKFSFAKKTPAHN
jgi:glycerol-3-phosphate acyltransferase PlsY